MPDFPMGPFMLDLEGPELLAEEREWLSHPGVGGIILFARNYQSPQQIKALTAQIRKAAKKPLVIAVDQEGGRVQRFQEGFTRLPSAARFGELYAKDHKRGLAAAQLAGFLMAAELRRVDMDLSFAPVLDVDSGISEVIGDRSFAREPEAVAVLAGAFANGMRQAGMAAVGKHFPGHGGVAADSHHTLPEDDRSWRQLESRDLLPFRRLIQSGLEAVMCAHVVYPAVDSLPAGFSSRWLQDILRGQMAFEGAIFSDDLAMAGAACMGDIRDRAEAALAAGCDLLLACNCPGESVALLDAIRWRQPPGKQNRLAKLRAKKQGLPLENLCIIRSRLEKLLDQIN